MDEIETRVSGRGAAGRFRPNLLIEGAEPWAEDGWTRLRVGAVEIELVESCTR